MVKDHSVQTCEKVCVCVCVLETEQERFRLWWLHDGGEPSGRHSLIIWSDERWCDDGRSDAREGRGEFEEYAEKKSVIEALGGERRGDDDQWKAVGWRVKRAEWITATGWATDRCDGRESDEEWQRRRRPRRGEEAIGRVTERLRLARKWCDWEKQRRRMDRDLVALTSDGFGTESRAHDTTFFNTSSTVFMPKSSSKTNVLSYQNHVFFISWMVSEKYLFAYLNQTIFCGYNFVDFSCLVQFTQLLSLFIPEGQLSFTVYQCH